MTCPFWTPEAKAAAARFDGQGANRLGMGLEANPFPHGPLYDAWAGGWISIPAWRRTEVRAAARALGASPLPRPCPDPNPRRVGYE